MELEQALENFRQRLVTTTHLKSFFKDAQKPFIIGLEVSDKCFMLELAYQSVTITHDCETKSADISIEGEYQALVSLINGSNRLQRLQKRNELSYQGRFSDLLKAETIFYLNQ